MDVIIKKYGTTHVIWFQNTKSFLLLEEPAFDVFQNYSKGVLVNDIIEVCQQKYGHLEGNIPQFVAEIMEHIDSYNNPENSISISKMGLINKKVICSSGALVSKYKTGDKLFSISYANENLRFAIHPIIAHLETDSNTSTAFKVECLEQDNILVLKLNGEVVKAFAKENIEYFTGGVKQLLISILNNRGYYYWMCMLHASGITSENKALLFSAASGSGKSTISALLKAKGYGYIADDFIAADKDGKAFAFPDAISVKQGSFKTLEAYYPELGKTSEQETFIGKTVRYLPITKTPTQGMPVKAFVFVNYSESEDFIFEGVDKKEALQLLLKETWVNPTPKFVTAFFSWVENTAFYRLQYTNIDEAEVVVRQILDKQD